MIRVQHIDMPEAHLTIGWYQPEAYAIGKNERERRSVAQLVSDTCGPAAALEHRDTGAPYISGIEHPPLISVSHCAEAAVVAVSAGRQIGVDIEQLRPQLQRVRHKYLSDSELELFSTPDLMLLAWTAKEAVYKAALTPGLALHDISLTLPEPSVADPTLMRSQATARGTHYDLWHLTLRPDIILTVALNYPPK